MSTEAPDDFSISRVLYGAHAVLTVTGELDAATAPLLKSALDELEAAGVERLVLDLRRLAFVDSSGLSVVVNAKKRLSATGNALCVVIEEGQRVVRRVFEITGLDKVIPVHADVQAAIDDCLQHSAA